MSTGSRRHTIVCLSSQRWNDGMWTNKQHIMSRLAKRHRVLFVEPGLNSLPSYLIKRYKNKPGDLRHPLRTLIDGSTHLGDGLSLLDGYAPLLLQALPKRSLLVDRATFDLKVWLARRWLEKRGIDDAIVWVYHPGYGDSLSGMPRSLLIYDCVDNYAAFPEFRDDPRWINAREERLCRSADLVTVTSPELYELRKPFNPDNTHLVHNVGDAEHFARAASADLATAPEVAALDGPVIGFVGAVSNYKLNVEWLLQAARARPTWQFVIVGPVGAADPSTEVGALERLANVHLLGLRRYADLPALIKGFDVAVIPYRINDYTRSVFPIKFFELLASGKPLVISNLPSLQAHYDSVYVAESGDEFVASCDAALAEDDPEAVARRMALAHDNSWPKRIGRIMELIEERLD